MELMHLLQKVTVFLCCLLLCFRVIRCSAPLKVLKIIKGEQVPINAYFFVASLLKRGKHVCGGSIVSHRFILTAAHCVVSKENVEVAAKDISVSLGNKFWAEGQKYQIDLITVHKDYIREKKLFDIALLRTFKSITIGPTVGTIRLNPVPFDDSVQNITATVLGWGFQDNEDGLLVSQPSGYIHYVDLFIIPWEVCKTFFGNRVSQSQLCVSSKDSRGSCNGDSGGPLITKVHDHNMQIGLVSFGGNCNNTVPEVYTRISAFYPWIRHTMRSKKHRFDLDATEVCPDCD